MLKNFVSKDFTKDLKVEDLTLVNKSFISSDYEESESDIVYSAKIGDTEAIFYNEEKFHSGILNFTYDIFDINNGFTKEELVNSKNVTAAIFLLDQKITPQEFLNRVKAIALFFDILSNEELKAIKHWIRNTTEERLAIKATEVLEASKEDVIKMVANNAFILREMEESAEKRAKLEVARNLLDVLDNETIALKTGLDIEEIKDLRDKNC